MRRKLTLALPGLILGLALACGAEIFYWHEFRPTAQNFREYFDEQADSLDDIEGLWNLDPYPEPATFVAYYVDIVRDERAPGWEYSGLYVPRTARATGSRQFIFVRYRQVNDTLYEFRFTRQPFQGTVTLMYNMLFVPADWDDPSQHEQVWTRNYPW